MCDEFVTFQAYLKRLNSLYVSALSSFYVFDTLKKLVAPNIVGENESEENLKVINQFRGFFVPARQAANFHFLMELAKLFDDAKESLHIEKLINYAEANNKHLSVKNFENANQDREFLEELTKRYEGLKSSDIKEIKKLIEDNKTTIDNLKTHRDQQLAHEDKNKKEVNITFEEVQTLFSIIEKIINTFSNKTDFSTTDYSYLKSDCEDHTDAVVENLKRFNSIILEERRKKSA